MSKYIKEVSTEKKILDRDINVSEIDKKIRNTDSEEKKKDLEKEKDKKDKEIKSKESDKEDNKNINNSKQMKESESIKKYKNIIIRDNERLSELLEASSSEFHKNEIKGLNDEVDNAEKFLHITRMFETAEFVKSDMYNEAADMEDEIKPIVNKLNSKGYKVKYASPGHNIRKKEDTDSNGIYYGRLYSDARIMFDKKYDFEAPKYWMHREVDKCSYLDIIPVKYEDKYGTPDEAFAKWKDSYMDSLREFADSLKAHSDGDVKTEAVSDVIMLGTLLGTGIITVAVKALKKAKLKKKWKLRGEALAVYPKKHKDCPDMSKLKRTKNQMSAFDGSKGKAVDDNDDNAPGNFVYTYTLDGKPVVIVIKEGSRFTSSLAKDIPAKYKEHSMYIYSYIIIFKHGWITPKIEAWLDKEIAENEKLKKQNGGKIVDDASHIKVGKEAEVKKESEEVNDSDLNNIYASTSFMDDTIESLLKENGCL